MRYLPRPGNDYDKEAWNAFWATNPDLMRSVGAEGNDDDNTGGNEGDDDDKNKGPDIATAVSTAVASAMGPVVESLQAIGTRLETLETSRGSEGEDDKDDKDQGDSTDVNLMDNRELVGHINKSVTEAIKGLSEQIKGAQVTSEETAARQELARVSGENSDFMEFKAEVRTELKGNPALTLEQAYKLAKVNNPDKVAELAEKVKEGKEDPDKEIRANAPFGGLLPTSGKTKANEKMKALDAAEAAWVDIMGSAGSETMQ